MSSPSDFMCTNDPTLTPLHDQPSELWGPATSVVSALADWIELGNAVNIEYIEGDGDCVAVGVGARKKALKQRAILDETIHVEHGRDTKVTLPRCLYSRNSSSSTAARPSLEPRLKAKNKLPFRFGLKAKESDKSVSKKGGKKSAASKKEKVAVPSATK
ncbi:hypothetical protein THAOC_04662 [Thalassiosira oceanica]|uniref:Uncharacterized protein n=1 Tax=Thalassiosira oceanica TaxID=159749 RepID=K0T9H7_THAOC|nr:hypothetical protein THAOC_04662 [Thalassiosira oceanica]|eukprot:EJK73699.1 hypothetical protein THAOC_04662 [Thalassiosira oceanica]